MGKQKGIDSSLDGLDFALKFKRLTPEQKTMVRAKMKLKSKIRKEVQLK